MGVKRSLEEAGIVSEKSDITEDEAALYDRQIRLWGVHCQKRLKEADILIIGLNGLGAEVVKNLALTGVHSLTILDDKEIQPSDNTAQFFVAGNENGKRSEVSKAAIQELNPNVRINIESGDVTSKPEDFFHNYTAVFATGYPLDVFIKIDKICREKSIMFFCADAWGLFGYCFLDLNTHEYLKVNKYFDGKKHVENSTRHTINYGALGRTLDTKVGEGFTQRVNRVFILLHIVNHFRELFNRYPEPDHHEQDLDHMRKIKGILCKTLGYDASKIEDQLLNSVFGELSPVCATVGGIIGNEIIKGITKVGKPVHNYFLFDGINCTGANELIVAKAAP